MPDRPSARAMLHGAALTASLFIAPNAMYAQMTGDELFGAAVSATKAQDYARAGDLFEQLAQGDDHDAQFNLALLLKAGKGQPQHFAQALEWAWRAELGGVTRAADVTHDLKGMLPPARLAEVAARIGTHLQDRLARGDRSAVMQFVEFNRSLPGKPDVQRAYVWASIGAALDLPDAAAVRDTLAQELDPMRIVELQDEAQELFKDGGMAARFRDQPRSGS